MTILHLTVSTILLATVLAPTGAGQTTPSTNEMQGKETSTSGVVSSSSRNSMVIKTPTGQFLLFVFGEDVVRPASIPNGSTVNVISSPREDGVQMAHYVSITSPASTGSATATGSPKPQGTSSSSDTVIPREVRDLERSIARQARRFQAGFQGGIGLDPEVILVGLNARMGPIFNRDIYFSPNVDFAFGEVTKAFQINLDALYRLPLTPRNSRWSAYVGAGPNFSFISQNYEKAQSGDNSIDFSDFEYKTGLNVITGVEYRSGLFYQLKAGVWTTPTLRLMVGYHF